MLGVETWRMLVHNTLLAPHSDMMNRSALLNPVLVGWPVPNTR